jgi:hypothetical protein
MVKPKIYKSYRKQILNDAKLQLKRHLGQTGRDGSQNRFFNSPRATNLSILKDYMILLHPFIKEKGMGQFFDRLLMSRDPNIRTTYVSLFVADRMELPAGMIDSLAAQVNSRGMLFSTLKKQGKLSLFPKQYKTPKLLAAACFTEQDMGPGNGNDPIFVEQRNLEYRQKKYTGHYFKLRDPQEDAGQYKMFLVVFENDGRLREEPYYKSSGMAMEDTDTDSETIRLVTEEFLLRDRPRAIVHRPFLYGSFGQFSM